MSDWVQKNDLGLSVSSLAELGDIISGVTDHQYQIYTENARVVAQRMQQGLYIREVFYKVVEKSVNHSGELSWLILEGTTT